MSGLDPVGRREVRDLILRLRDDGRTVLFSSHILSDAEALCSRVGILSKGRLVAHGTVSELTAGAGPGRGWEIVMSGVSPLVADRIGHRVRKLTRIADTRYGFELGPDDRPEPFVAELAATGAALVSVTPLKTTLEDVFLEHVGSGAGLGSGGAGPRPVLVASGEGSGHADAGTTYPRSGTR